jgi:protein SCO1/2
MKTFRNVGIALVAITAMAVGFWLSSSIIGPNQAESQAIQGNKLPVARKIAVPELLKDDGSVFTNSDLQGHWTLMFFGYTHCPDICPTTLGVLAQAKKNFGNDFPKINFPEVMLVSVDPQRDTVKVLNEYVKYFEPTFIGVTGQPEMIKALTLQMSVVYMQAPGLSDNNDNYIVDHSSAILMINPEGKLHAFLNAPHSVTSIVNSVRVLMN